VWGADSGLTASAGTFVIDFYDSSKLSSSSGTGLTNDNYSSFVKVGTGLTKTNVVTSVSVTGTVRYGMNGGLTAGTGTAAGESSHYVTFNTGTNFLVRKATVYATAYESGRWKLNGNTASSGSLGSKGATFANVTSPLLWSFSTYTNALTFKKDNGSGGNQKRLTIYTIVCEYGYRAYLTAPGTGSISAAPKTTNENGAGWNSTEGAVVGLKSGQKVTLTATPPDGYELDEWTIQKKSDNSNITASVLDGNELTMPAYDVKVSVTWKSAAPACANTVTINKGASTNCSFSLDISGAQASCDGVVTTISITPNTGYGTPVVSESGASSTPTKGGSGNSQTLTYAANTTGTSTIAVSCSANNYTINLDKDLTPTSAGTPSITATYNASTNLTSAITPPTKTGWTFAGYFTAKNGGGTQIIDAGGNVIASVSGYTDASKNWKYAGNITLYAKWTCTVTWSVNNLTNVYSAQTLTYNGSSTKIASVPGPPSPASYCGDKFVGWTTEANVSQDDDDGLGLFTTVAGSPELKTVGNTTFYAVFADYDD
jgi:hypothetical protein